MPLEAPVMKTKGAFADAVSGPVVRAFKGGPSPNAAALGE
jgi:hypothetical protein